MTGYLKEIGEAVKAFAKVTSGEAQFDDNAFSSQASEDGRNIYVTIDYRKADPAASRGIKEMRDAMEAMRFFSSRIEHGTDALEMMYSLPNTFETVAQLTRMHDRLLEARCWEMVQPSLEAATNHLYAHAHGNRAESIRASLLEKAKAELGLQPVTSQTR